MADAGDLKSPLWIGVRVRIPSPVPKRICRFSLTVEPMPSKHPARVQLPQSAPLCPIPTLKAFYTNIKQKKCSGGKEELTTFSVYRSGALSGISSIGQSTRLITARLRFESVISDQFRGVAQWSTASGCLPESRGFESRHPDQHAVLARGGRSVLKTEIRGNSRGFESSARRHMLT